MAKKSKQKQTESKSKDTSPTPVTESAEELVIPDNFNDVLYDFISDLITTFPEHQETLSIWHNKELHEETAKEIFRYMLTVYPERFFDILYQNEDIFSAESDINVHFLPNIDFRVLYNSEGLSQNSKNAIWKYLQLILISILGSIQDKSKFGDTMNMFEGVDENVLQEKLAETINSIGDFFSHLGVDSTNSGQSDEEECPDLFDEAKTKEFLDNMESKLGEDLPGFKESFEKMKGEMPKAEDIHDHLKGLFEGKIGSLAKELAEEISSDMADMFGVNDAHDIKSTQDILKKMIKNPKKMMDMMKTISNKLQSKMKSGEISEQDIMKEAGEILGKMKGLGGKDNKEFTEIFKNLTKTMGGGLGKTKMNMGALNQFSKNLATRERLQTKLEQKRNQKPAELDPDVNLKTTDSLSSSNLVFSVVGDEKQEKSYRRPLSSSDITDATLSVSSVAAAQSAPVPEKDIDSLVKEIESMKPKKTKSNKKK
jgi:hypothetical protein